MLLRRRRILAIAHIIVVDDETELRDSVARLLERGGHSTETCSNGRSALKQLEKGGFDMLITDISMPVMDGVELIKKTLACAFLPHQRIVALTGLDERHPSVKWLTANNVDVLYKPLRSASLNSKLQDLFGAITAAESH